MIEHIGGDSVDLEKIRRETRARYKKELQRDNIVSFTVGVACIAVLIGIPAIAFLLTGFE